MKTLLLSTLIAGLLATAAHANDHGDERPDHFKGEPAPDLATAVANFSTYNQQLAAILAADELGVEDLGTVHELTYTLENALETITAQVADMAVTLEEVHQGSETGDVERVRSNGEIYLEAARTLVP
ncbi:DUF6746 family protein [Halomonas alkalicola]|uniref:DUF6746 family protein n=1 Tax=Halomonas alkalicola TaxID=1930622 RepID=UPI00265D89A8|nr:DUF6746 family protein [Halomonas alkalicola]